MAANMPVAPRTIKYDGVFDFEGLYRMMQQWMTEEGFYFEERTYKHKVPSVAGAEQEMEWGGWKNITDYVRLTISMNIKIWDLKELEVIKEGEKKRLCKGMLRIIISGMIELDYSGRFKGSKFAQSLKDFYDKYVLGYDEGMVGSVYWDQHYYRIYKLQTLIKEFLDMESKGNAYYDMW